MSAAIRIDHHQPTAAVASNARGNQTRISDPSVTLTAMLRGRFTLASRNGQDLLFRGSHLTRFASRCGSSRYAADRRWTGSPSQGSAPTLARFSCCPGRWPRLTRRRAGQDARGPGWHDQCRQARSSPSRPRPRSRSPARPGARRARP